MKLVITNFTEQKDVWYFKFHSSSLLLKKPKIFKTHTVFDVLSGNQANIFFAVNYCTIYDLLQRVWNSHLTAVCHFAVIEHSSYSSCQRGVCDLSGLRLSYSPCEGKATFISTGDWWIALTFKLLTLFIFLSCALHFHQTVLPYNLLPCIPQSREHGLMRHLQWGQM